MNCFKLMLILILLEFPLKLGLNKFFRLYATMLQLNNDNYNGLQDLSLQLAFWLGRLTLKCILRSKRRIFVALKFFYNNF